jgi:ATP-binding cassette subfamily B protein
MTTARKNDTLWKITAGQRLRYAASIVAMAASSLAMFGAPLVAKYAIDAVIDGDLGVGIPALAHAAARAAVAFGSTDIVWYLALSAVAAVLVTMVGGCFLYLRGLTAAIASEAIVRRLREELYRHLHALQARFYDTADTGDLVQRCSSDVETLRVFLSSDVVEIGRAILLVLTVTPILFWMDPRLAWVSLSLLPFIFLGAFVFFTKVKALFQVTDEAEGELTAVLQENLTGIRVVRAFARQEFEIAKFAQRNAAFRDHNNRLIALMGKYWGTQDLFSQGQIALVLFTGALFVMDGSMTVGTLFAFLTYIGMIIWPIRQLGRVLTDSGKAVVALGRMNDILRESEESLEPAPRPGRADGAIEFKGVTFGYAADRPVLRDLSFSARAGETIALVGAPGSGKSTIIRLLLRLYPYSAGSITIDGQEIAGVSRQWLRSQIGVVLQDPFLYSRTVAQNLRVGRPDAPEEHLVQAARDAAIHDSIERLQEGYGALVGERGVTLSGGQRQRLALARALLKDPPVLVLDDSLSAVDTGTEARILAALKARKGRHTTIVIAHRLSSVRHADRILVLEEGRLVQHGDHATLIAQTGPYRRLCEIQGALDEQIQRDMDQSAAAKTRGQSHV